MKRWICFAFLLLIVLPCAQASDAKYAYENEAFYHDFSYCGGMDGRSNVSAEGRYPCPVCVESERKTYDQPQTAVERGGTIVNRFTDDYGDDEEWESHEIFAFYGSNRISGMEAYAWLCEHYNGDELMQMAGKLSHGEVTELWCRQPFVIGYYPDSKPGSRMLSMSRRCINGCWYQCFRAEDGSRIRMKDLHWRFNDTRVEFGEEWLEYTWSNEVTDVPQLSLTGGAGEEQLYFEERGSISVRVMREMDTYICVLRQHNAYAAMLENVVLHIGGSFLPIKLNGYMDGTDGVYVTVLCEGEYRLIEDGASVTLLYEDWSTDADFHGTDYAAVTYGSAGDCIIDRAYNIVYGPDANLRITHLQRSNGSMLFHVWDIGNAHILLNGDTLEKEAEYREADGYVNFAQISSEVYRLMRAGEETAQYYSLTDHSLLFSMDASVDFTGSECYYVSSGIQQRLVAREGNHDCWLTDLKGEKIAGTEYNDITPLAWKDDTGIFLVAVYDVPEDDWDDHYPRLHAEQLYYGNALRDENEGSSWRCGLIDQDGNVLAEPVYTTFIMISDRVAKLSDGENAITVPF